jgi:hypothetical protein
MKNCLVCEKEIQDDGIQLNGDGDVACSENCCDLYNVEKNYFFECVCKSDYLLKRWMDGEEIPQ